MKVRSDDFKNGDYLNACHLLSTDYGFGCDGGNESPHLAWDSVPTGTRSIAITCYDPDAPTGSGFWHWLVVNITPDTREVVRNAGHRSAANLPKGALQTRTDYGQTGYGGPCPPDGPHRYLFTIYALSIDAVPVEADTPTALVGFHLNANSLAKATIIGLARPGMS